MTPFEAVFGQTANDGICVGSQETDEFIDEEKVEYMFDTDGDLQTGVRTDNWTDSQTDTETYSQIETETDSQTETETNSQTEIETDSHTDEQTGSQTRTVTDGEIECPRGFDGRLKLLTD
jgi:hypothetical protein